MQSVQTIWQSLRRISWILMIVYCLGITACGGGSNSVTTPLPPIPIPTLEPGVTAVGMPVRTVLLGSTNLKLLGLPINVAGQTTELLLDTGSAGIRVLASAIGSAGLIRTDIPSTVSFADGTTFDGVIGQAPVSIGAASSSGAINIQIIDQVRCNDGNCPDELFDGTGFFSGIVGVSLANRTSEPLIFSPIAQLAGNFSSGYIIQTGGFNSTQGVFTAGLTSNNRAGFAIRQLGQPPSLPTFANGVPIWDDEILTNFTISNTTIQNVPDLAAYDTGSSDISINTSALGAPFLQFGSILPGGSQFIATVPGIFNFTINVQTPPTPGLDRIFVNSQFGVQLIGMPFFFRADTLFDINQGQVGFRPAT